MDRLITGNVARGIGKSLCIPVARKKKDLRRNNTKECKRVIDALHRSWLSDNLKEEFIDTTQNKCYT